MSESIKSFDQLLTQAKTLAGDNGPVRAALIGADDPIHLRSIVRAVGAGIIDPIIIGPKAAIEDIANKAGIDAAGLNLIACDSRVSSIEEAIKLISENRVDMLIRGRISTGLVLARLFERPTGLRWDNRLVSHVAVFEHELYPKLLMMSDGGVTVAPGIDQKLSIIQNAVEVAGLLGVEMPKVALLAAVEVIYTAMPVTMEAAIISKMADKKQIKNCRIDGPLSMDVAVVPEIARQKRVVSEVAGDADILIAPDIETGNGIYKAMSMFARAKTAGIIVGGKIPITLSSRCDGEENVFHSLVLGGLYSLSRK
jgi:phosphate butyryltransferase